MSLLFCSFFYYFHSFLYNIERFKCISLAWKLPSRSTTSLFSYAHFSKQALSSSLLCCLLPLLQTHNWILESWFKAKIWQRAQQSIYKVHRLSGVSVTSYIKIWKGTPTDTHSCRTYFNHILSFKDEELTLGEWEIYVRWSYSISEIRLYSRHCLASYVLTYLLSVGFRIRHFISSRYEGSI